MVKPKDDIFLIMDTHVALSGETRPSRLGAVAVVFSAVCLLLAPVALLSFRFEPASSFDFTPQLLFAGVTVPFFICLLLAFVFSVAASGDKNLKVRKLGLAGLVLVPVAIAVAGFTHLPFILN